MKGVIYLTTEATETEGVYNCEFKGDNSINDITMSVLQTLFRRGVSIFATLLSDGSTLDVLFTEFAEDEDGITASGFINGDPMLSATLVASEDDENMFVLTVE